MVAASSDNYDASALQGYLDSLVEGQQGVLFADMIGTFRAELVSVGAIARDSGWCAPEILRGQGVQILRRAGTKKADHAEALFERSLALARQQGALSWEIRTATSLARLWKEQGRGKPGHDLLASVYGQFTEGFQTADLTAAKRLLDELASDGELPHTCFLDGAIHE
jgi:hypothetical protein